MSTVRTQRKQPPNVTDLTPSRAMDAIQAGQDTTIHMTVPLWETFLLFPRTHLLPFIIATKILESLVIADPRIGLQAAVSGLEDIHRNQLMQVSFDLPPPLRRRAGGRARTNF